MANNKSSNYIPNNNYNRIPFRNPGHKPPNRPNSNQPLRQFVNNQFTSHQPQQSYHPSNPQQMNSFNTNSNPPITTQPQGYSLPFNQTLPQSLVFLSVYFSHMFKSEFFVTTTDLYAPRQMNNTQQFAALTTSTPQSFVSVLSKYMRCMQ